jgi:hypothetical protein
VAQLCGVVKGKVVRETVWGGLMPRTSLRSLAFSCAYRWSAC